MKCWCEGLHLLALHFLMITSIFNFELNKNTKHPRGEYANPVKLSSVWTQSQDPLGARAQITAPS